MRFFPNSRFWVRYDAAGDTMIVLLALLVSAILAFGGGCDAFRNGQALQVLGAASPIIQWWVVGDQYPRSSRSARW